MSKHKLVPVEPIMRAIYALERFANDTLAGRNSAHELRELLAAAPDVQGEPAEWDGTGLPPVGSICEAKVPQRVHALPGILGYAWRKVEVCKTGGPDAPSECLVFDLETTIPSWADEFRPIRTPEQNPSPDVTQLVEALEELVDLMEDTRQGEYIPDSFTTQPARIALANHRKGGSRP